MVKGPESKLSEGQEGNNVIDERDVWLRNGLINVVDRLDREDLLEISELLGIRKKLETTYRDANLQELRRRIAVEMVLDDEFMESSLSEGGNVPFFLITGRWQCGFSGTTPPPPLNFYLLEYKASDGLNKAKLINRISRELWPRLRSPDNQRF